MSFKGVKVAGGAICSPHMVCSFTVKCNTVFRRGSISLYSDIEPIRKMVGRRLMSDKWGKEGQKQLDDMLLTLHQAGFITLVLEDGTQWQDLDAV